MSILPIVCIHCTSKQREDKLLFEYIFSPVSIAIAISMDCFSVAIAIGLMERSLRKIVFISLLLGLFHSLFPLIGMLFGAYLLPMFQDMASFISGLILLCLGFYILFSTMEKEKQQISLKRLRLVTLCMMVSIDSFPVGFSLSMLGMERMLLIILFGCTATLFSFIGLYFARKLHRRTDVYSELISSLLLIGLGLKQIWMTI